MASTKLELTPGERSLGLQWVAATIVGWAIGFFVCEAIKPFLFDITHLGGDGLVIGAGVGIAQGLVLRRQTGRFGSWVLLSSLGFGIGKLAGETIAQGMTAALGHLVTGAVIGVAVGIAQWLILRRHVARAEWWVLANVAAWAVGWSVISLVEGAEDIATLIVYLIGGSGAALAGIITAYALLRLRRARPA